MFRFLSTGNFSSLRFRLMLLVLLVLLPALGLTLATGLERRRVAAEGVKNEAERLARLAASNEEALIEGARQLLIALGQIPEVRAGDPSTCSAFLAKLMKRYSNYSAMSVAGLDGMITCSSVSAELPVYVGDRDYYVRGLQERDFVIGSYIFGRLSKRAVLPFAYPVLDDSGQIEVLLIASLDLAWLNRLASEIQFPEQYDIRIMDGNGTLLARYPDPEEWVGKRLPEDALLRAIQATRGDGTAEVVGIDGVKRLYGFTRLGGPGGAGVETNATVSSAATLSVGIPTGIAYAEVNRSLIQSLAALGLVAILTLAAAWISGEVFILQRVRDLVAATRRLAAGDLAARTGIPPGKGEISELAAAFDQMAGTLEQREAQLMRSNRELQDFAYIASHDLQEPLRKIQAFGERLSTRHSQALGQEGQEYIGRMVNDAARLQTMINDLLAYSRVSSRARPFAPLSLSSLAAEAVSDLQARLQETGGKVEIGSLPVVEGDALQLRQLFQNLIGNALKFRRPDLPPVVKVYARKPGGPGTKGNGSQQTAGVPSLSAFSAPAGPAGATVQIVVEDNGIGFDEKYLGRIFEPFQRLHGRGVYEGSGIGLSICRKIAERHGGQIAAKSKPGEGAQFIVTLPLKQPVSAPVKTGTDSSTGDGAN